MQDLLTLHAVSKRFGAVVGLQDVDLTLGSGEVLGIVGDNGAGKSTLLRILSGVIKPDSGTLHLDGEEVHWRSPRDALRAGVATVHQDLGLVDCLDLATNIFLGNFPRSGPFVARARMHRAAALACHALELIERSPHTPVTSLTAGQRQVVAIARALEHNAKVVTFDEPTSALGITETKRVLNTLDDLRRDGRGVILVSHDLDLVLACADRVQVLRQGQTAGVLERGCNRDELIGLITGARQAISP